jgi:hypothetical protein
MAILINDGMPREPRVTKTRPPAITVHPMPGTDLVSTAKVRASIQAISTIDRTAGSFTGTDDSSGGGRF